MKVKLMRMIDVDDLKKRATERCPKCPHKGSVYCQQDCDVQATVELIDSAPLVTIPQGTWKFKENGQLIRFQGKWSYTTGGNWGCSNCYNYSNHKYDWCPYCGADMRKGGAE